MSKSRLIKRLQWYYPLEKIHAYVTVPALIAYCLYTYSTKDIILLVYGLLVCSIILYQGQWYWKLKLDRLLGKQVNQKTNLAFFKRWKRRNPKMFLLMPFMVFFQLYLQKWDHSNNHLFLWGILANVFAILEHINYYHTQLMVDNIHDVLYILNNKQLKKASLAKDLAEQKI